MYVSRSLAACVCGGYNKPALAQFPVTFMDNASAEAIGVL
jgi:hypothetical protein